MKNRRIFIKSATALAVSSIAHFPAQAGGGMTGGATEVTQLANNVQLVLQYAKQLQQYATQISNLQNQIMNTARLPGRIWGQVMTQVNGIRNVLKKGQALAYSMVNIDKVFKDAFKGYQPVSNFSQEYKEWSVKALDTFRGTAAALGMANEQMDDDEAYLVKVRELANSSEGRQKTLEVANMFAEQGIQQMMKMRQLMMADIGSKQAFYSYQVDKDAKVQATLNEIYAPQSNSQGTNKGVSASREW